MSAYAMRRVAAAALIGLAAGPYGAHADPDPAWKVGRAIYENGVLSNGEPLVADWGEGVRLSGERAACAQCHRNSGTGGYEGGSLVPSITGPALFQPPQSQAGRATVWHSMRLRDFHFRERPPYDSATLQRVLVDGVTPAGHELSTLMPRYQLSPTDFSALEAYLRQLGGEASPGVEGKEVHWATIFTPAARPQDREAVTQVLQACFQERYPDHPRSTLTWRLHVWDLKGDASDWSRQLADYQRQRPVLGVMSGIGGADWAPVHRFCESEGLPCLFPNVDAPGATEPGRYSFYYSAGTVLEGRVMARWMSSALAAEHPPISPLRVVVWLPPANAAAEAGVAAMVQALRSEWPAATVVPHRLADLTPATLQQAAAALAPGDVLSLWLPHDELRQVLQQVPVPDVRQVLASGWLGLGVKLQPSAAWRERLRMVYPFETPTRYFHRMERNVRPWLKAHQIGGGAPREIYLGNALSACHLAVEGVAKQLSPITREQLIEQIENYPLDMGNAPAYQGYHGFSLGRGQRFSAKGAFVVRYTGPQPADLETVSDWITP